MDKAELVGIEALVGRLGPLAPVIVAVEATGGLESVMAASLGAAGLPVVNPARVRAFAQALGRRAKSDPIDAEVIAELPELGTLGRRQVAALADLAPFTRQSGQWKGKASIGGGRTTVRASVFMGAMVAVRHNPVLKASTTASSPLESPRWWR